MPQFPYQTLDRSGKPVCRDRHFGEHLATYRVQGVWLLRFMSFPLAYGIVFQMLLQNWETAILLMAVVALNLWASVYVLQAEYPHPFARFLGTIYFSTIRDSSQRARRRYIRIPILPILFLLFFVTARFSIPLGPVRPPLPGLRFMKQVIYLDYLREHHYFCTPPTPAPPPPEP